MKESFNYIDHGLKTNKIVVKENCLDVLLEDIHGDDFVVFNSSKKVCFLERLKSFLAVKKKSFKVFNLIDVKAEIRFVDGLDGCDKSTIIAIGDERLISIAKYYAYVWDCELIIFPMGEFLDYTFSKFARLNDGVLFDFYVTVEPKKIYVDVEANKFNVLHLSYIASKYIALFDNAVLKHVYWKNLCEKCEAYFKKALNYYLKNINGNENELNIKNIWLLIRLGQGMSYFHQTKLFFGGDKAFVDILQAVHPKVSFLEAESVALKLIKNQYLCFYKSIPTKANVNLNNHIVKLTKLLNVSYQFVVKRLALSEYILGDNKMFLNFNNYFYYLRSVLSKCLSKMELIESKIKYKQINAKKINFTDEKIIKCFALAGDLYNKPCSMHVFSAFGYLDKLI